VNDLRSQVTGLNEQIAAMHDQIDRLADLVTNMQVATAPSSSSAGDMQKKRKLTVKGASSSSAGVMLGAVPLQRMSSTDSTMMIGEYRAAGEDLPSGPDLLRFADGSDFFGEDANDAMNTSGSGAQDWDGQNEDLDMLFTAGLMDEDEPAVVGDLSLPQASAVMAAPVTATAAPAAAAIGVVNNAATEISNVLDGLSPELRLRFVDRLAEVMGAHLTQNIAQQVQAQQPEKTLPYMVPAPAYTPAASYAPAPEAGQFLLPSGSRAPEIAIPLASAAIAALLSSMQSFSQSHHAAHLQQSRPQAQHLAAIKEEVACK
jgi:hypothetical protein